MFDTHCHLYLDQFKNDLDEVILEAKKSGVKKVIIPGINFGTSKLSIGLSSHYPDLLQTAVGIHPNYSYETEAGTIESLLEDSREQIIAIGEIGLDYFRTYSPKHTQLLVLGEMLELAYRYGLSICLHNREADEDLVNMLSKWYSTDSSNIGVFHAYNGSPIITEWGKSHGFMFGIGGLITYKNSDNLREMVKMIGMERIVLETDSPYLTPVPFRGKRNTPANLYLIVEALAGIFDVDEQYIIDITDRNAMELFGFY